MTGWTNKGKAEILKWAFQNTGAPTNLYMALVTDTPDADTNVLGDLTEIAAGNGYTAGGYQLSRNATDFDTLTEDDSGDMGTVAIKKITWTASGGNIPSSGDGALYAVITDDNATLASRKVIAYGSLGTARAVSDKLEIDNFTLRLKES